MFNLERWRMLPEQERKTGIFSDSTIRELLTELRTTFKIDFKTRLIKMTINAFGCWSVVIAIGAGLFGFDNALKGAATMGFLAVFTLIVYAATTWFLERPTEKAVREWLEVLYIETSIKPKHRKFEA